MFANVRYFLMSVIKSGDPRFPLSDSLSKTAVTERRALCRFEPNSRQTVCPHWGGRIFAAANCPFPFFYICILSCPPGSRRQHIFVRLHLELEEWRQRSYRTNKKVSQKAHKPHKRLSRVLSNPLVRSTQRHTNPPYMLPVLCVWVCVWFCLLNLIKETPISWLHKNVRLASRPPLSSPQSLLHILTTEPIPQLGRLPLARNANRCALPTTGSQGPRNPWPMECMRQRNGF